MGWRRGFTVREILHGAAHHKGKTIKVDRVVGKENRC